MSFLLTLLRFHRQRLTAIGLGLGCVLLLALLVPSFSLAPGAITLLGNVSAAPPVAATPLPPGDRAAPVVRPAETMRQADSQQRGVTADLPPSTAYQAPLLTALNCAREQAGQPPLVHDPQLSDAASGMWRELVRRPTTTLAELAGSRYAQVAVLPLTLAEQQAMPDTGRAPEQPDGPCVIGGLDLTQLDLTGATSIGVAVFPDPHPEDGLDDSSAVVVAK